MRAVCVSVSVCIRHVCVVSIAFSPLPPASSLLWKINGCHSSKATEQKHMLHCDTSGDQQRSAITPNSGSARVMGSSYISCWILESDTNISNNCKIDTFQTRCLCRLLRIFWPNAISNEEISIRTPSLYPML